LFFLLPSLSFFLPHPFYVSSVSQSISLCTRLLALMCCFSPSRIHQALVARRYREEVRGIFVRGFCSNASQRALNQGLSFQFCEVGGLAIMHKRT
jgi:hypothetical protein